MGKLTKESCLMDKKAKNHSELRMIIAFRGDLTEMTRGKSEVQAAHAAFSAGVRLAVDKPLLVNQYLAAGQPKICVEVENEDHLNKVIERAHKRGASVETVRDEGRTIFNGPTLTCAIIGPISKTDSNAITRGTRMRDKNRNTIASSNNLEESSWPTTKELTDCSANAVAEISIKSGAVNADFPGDGEGRKPEDEKFWERVRLEADRIAAWVVDGLGITGKAEKADS